MDAEKPILSYAQPIRGGETEGVGDFSVSFAPPPVREAILVNVAGITACTFGGLIFLVFGLAKLRDRYGIDWLTVLTAWSFGLACLLVGVTRFPELRRLRRYDGSPVRIELRGTTLSLSDP